MSTHQGIVDGGIGEPRKFRADYYYIASKLARSGPLTLLEIVACTGLSESRVYSTCKYAVQIGWLARDSLVGKELNVFRLITLTESNVLHLKRVMAEAEAAFAEPP